MNKQEINEFLAERLFGLRKGVDFGDKLSKIIRLSESDGDGWYCRICCAEIAKCGINSQKYKDFKFEHSQHYAFCPDYISNYQRVLNKIAEIMPINYKIEIFNDGAWEKYGVYICQGNVEEFYGENDTLGEAVCRAAVEYLKAQEVRDE